MAISNASEDNLFRAIERDGWNTHRDQQILEDAPKAPTLSTGHWDPRIPRELWNLARKRGGLPYPVIRAFGKVSTVADLEVMINTVPSPSTRLRLMEVLEHARDAMKAAIRYEKNAKARGRRETNLDESQRMHEVS
ncbi:hypothetical protein HY213_01000 [Candidatus Peregrinibacteria bacterium]|nr:hypothetical protein [Candidatus Peregrinibacteria bacterium]